jgi:hypothetical protein
MGRGYCVRTTLSTMPEKTKGIAQAVVTRINVTRLITEKTIFNGMMHNTTSETGTEIA